MACVVALVVVGVIGVGGAHGQVLPLLPHMAYTPTSLLLHTRTSLHTAVFASLLLHTGVGASDAEQQMDTDDGWQATEAQQQQADDLYFSQFGLRKDQRRPEPVNLTSPWYYPQHQKHTVREAFNTSLPRKQMWACREEDCLHRQSNYDPQRGFYGSKQRFRPLDFRSGEPYETRRAEIHRPYQRNTSRNQGELHRARAETRRKQMNSELQEFKRKKQEPRRKQQRPQTKQQKGTQLDPHRTNRESQNTQGKDREPERKLEEAYGSQLESQTGQLDSQRSPLEPQNKEPNLPGTHLAPQTHQHRAKQKEPRRTQLEPQTGQQGPRRTQLEPQTGQLEPHRTQLEPQTGQLEPHGTQLESQRSPLKPQNKEPRRRPHRLHKRHPSTSQTSRPFSPRRRRRSYLQFTQSEYRQTVPENIPLHTSILTVRVTGAGGVDVRYTLTDRVNFGIDESGVIYNLRLLDYERTGGYYVVQVSAELEGGGHNWWHKPVATANIQVTDAPEDPYFLADNYHFVISELAPKGSYVGRVSAIDDDEDLDYYFLDGVDPPNMFSINSVSGVVTVGRPPGGTVWDYSFLAGAVDARGQVALVPVTVSTSEKGPSLARLVLVANDDNKHGPVFPDCASYDEIHVHENVTTGTPVLLVLAKDGDTGRSGTISYSLLRDFESFAIHPSNQHGQITTTRVLDRDDDDKEFRLSVIAKDNGLQPLQDTCSFKVIVEDVNDNPPIFDHQRYDKTLATDHIVGNKFLRVSASDRDIGLNAHITYHLEGDPSAVEYFYMHPQTGDVDLKMPLDPALANIKMFEMRVRAVDGGTPPLWSVVPLTVKVVSSGELPPSVVKQDPRHPAIRENTTENTEVLTLCARSNLPNYPNVYFTLLNGETRDTNADGTFAIRRLSDGSDQCGETTGVTIFVATRNLDYESLQVYNLNLLIVNERNARLEQRVTVDIVDVNDNAPLLQPFDGAVLENTDGALITTIKAVDKDASPQFRMLTYSFDATASPDVLTKFSLKPNGELWTTQSLDREEVNQYRVPIQVTDGVLEHTRMTTYWITVQDLNDVAPEFDREQGVYEVRLPENREVGKPTGIRLDVTDTDIVNHFTYEIVDGNDEQKFRIDPSTRNILVNKPLDFDLPTRDRNFTLTIRVSDGENTPAETDVIIAVVNVNDLQPIFQQPNYTFVITENTDCNIILGKVSALDPDLQSSANQNIMYYLSPDEQKNFTVDSRSGQLTIRGCLDRESAVRGSVTLYPRANDEGGSGHDADPATVYVTIRDLNDNFPHFIRPDQSYARILENMEPHLVEPVIIELDDVDSDDHGCPCSLEFHAATPITVREKFTLTPTGRSRYRLSPVTVLDREAQKVYRLPFTSRDSRGMAGTRYLTLEVGDENDSPMSDGTSSIKVYNYQGQFPSMVIGAVHVTDADDDDRQDKTFEVDASTSLEVASHFKVDLYTGDITMQKGTPAGTHPLRVEVYDNFRRERAVGETKITVVDLTLEAVMQSGSIRVANTTTKNMLLQTKPGKSGTSLYERLKKQIALIHNIPDGQVDVFSLRDVPGGRGGVDVRYNCHGSPYYTATRLDGVMLRKREQVSKALGVEIALVDINECLYEETSPCQSKSCQHTMRPNLTSPLVVSSDTATLVGVDITDDYACDCGALEPLPSVCFVGFCYNGGKCVVRNSTLMCECPDDSNYGPRCELLTARFERGYAWYEPLTVCEHSSVSIAFQTNDKNGIILYTGPTVPSPWMNYPKDFLYVFLRNWVVETYLDLGTGTLNISIPIEANIARTFEYMITWHEGGVTAEVLDCGINMTIETDNPCRRTLPLPRFSNKPSHLLNVQGPLQIGGMAAMTSFPELATSFGWTSIPPIAYPFSGCVLELRHNEFIYDLNATDYSKMMFQPCDAPRTSRVVLGQQSIIIIFASLLCLLILVVVILCLARQGRKSISYPDLDKELVKETMGGTDLEGFGEKDVTHYNLKFLQVTPDGYLVGDENDGALPDVAKSCQRLDAPLAQMPEGLSIGDFIKENVLKVNEENQDVDDVRHYNAQGDEMSAASLSSLASGSSKSEGIFDYRNDWGQRFDKLAQLYRPESDAEEDSEYEFADAQPSETLNLSSESTPAEHPPSSSSSSSSPSTTRQVESPNSLVDHNPEGAMIGTEIAQEVTTPVIEDHTSSPHVSSVTAKPSSDSSTLVSYNPTMRDALPTSLTNQTKPPRLDNPSSPLPSRINIKAPPSPVPSRRQVESPTSLSSRYSSDNGVTTISNLYTNPALRSMTLGRPNKTSNLTANGTSGPGAGDTRKGGLQNVIHSQTVIQGHPTLKKSEMKDKPKGAKGVETWC